MKKWTQTGHAVISNVDGTGGLPVMHGFFLPLWEAESAVRSAQVKLPPHLRKDIKVVPATLHYEWE